MQKVIVAINPNYRNAMLITRQGVKPVGDGLLLEDIAPVSKAALETYVRMQALRIIEKDVSPVGNMIAEQETFQDSVQEVPMQHDSKKKQHDKSKKDERSE